MDFDPNLPWRDVRGEGDKARIGPFRFAALGDGRWCATTVLDARHINVGGVCHGGMMLSLAVIAMGATAFAAGGGHPCATIQIDGHFLSAAKQGQPLVVAATQLHKVRKISFMQCEIWAGDRLAMRAGGTRKYLARRSPGATDFGAIL